ncbi:MAG TPA: type VI secretion system membrane subunit TssM [Candidatus Binatia bacterium]|nr:type VI secretion system membrane subunit TssM [Candidatus Binatia bacterium]
MRRALRLVFNRFVLGAVGLLAIGLVIWWVGPTISVAGVYPLESEWARWLLIGAIVLIVVGRLVWRAVRKRLATAALTTGLLKAAAPAGEVRPDVSAEEVAQLRQRFEQALAMLRKVRFGTDRPSLWARVRALGSRQYLYDLPWYVFIGAPGAGKTTALVNSGLRFPLADRLGREAVRGVGGTRNCDWWFTDEAVFLDTAGRYTTQESSRDVDAGAWKGFLQLLKKSRPRRPINGVLVTVSIGDLLRESPSSLDAQAEAVRSRVQELTAELGVRFPVYVLVSKSDLLAGFSEFFAALGREERGQVWGFSLPFGGPAPAGLDPAVMAAELPRLEQRLYERLPDRLEEERDPARRALLYGFPQQFALLRDRLIRFTDVAFAPTRFEAIPLLRGIYFTSGTQEGSPIDRVMSALGRDLALERMILPAQQPSGRSYFLTRLLREVVFPESGLAGLDLKGERRRQWLRRAAIAGAAALVVLATAAWWVSYTNNRAYLAEVEGQLAEVKKHVDAVQAGAKGDLADLLPTLTRVRTLAETPASAGGSVPWSWRFGLYQGGKLEAATRAAYQRMLQATLLPSLVAYLEQHLRQDPAADPGEAYDALRTYVMLYDGTHFDAAAAWRWYETHGEPLMPATRPDAARDLKAHFDALYARGWVDPSVPQNEALLAQVRAAVGRESLAGRIYERLKREPLPDVRDFTVVDKAGPRAMLVFERTSREPLTKGVPAFYTKDAYYKHFAKRADQAALELAQEEPWVLGTGGAVGAAVSSPKVAEQVKRLYLDEYRQTWRRFIDDIATIRGRDLVRLIEVTRVISSPLDSPLKPLVKAIEREVTLSVPPDGDPGLASTIAGKAQQYAGKARQAITGGPPGSLEKALVDDHFEDVRRFASAPAGAPGPAPVDGIIQQLNDFYQMLVAAKVAVDTAQTLPPTDAATRLSGEVARLPEPVRSMLQALVGDGTRQVVEKTRERQAEEARQLRQKELDEARVARERQAEDARLLREKQAEESRMAREKQVEESRMAREKQAEEARIAREKSADDARVAQEKQKADIRLTRERIDAELRAQITDFCVKAIDGRYPFVRASQKDVTPEDFSRLFAPGGLLDTFFQKNLAPHVDTSQKPWRFRDPIMGSAASLADFQRAQAIREVFFRGGGNAPSIQLEFKPVTMDASITQFVLDVDGKPVRYAHGPQRPERVQFPGPGGRSQVRVSVAPPAASGSSSMRFDGPWALFRMFDAVNVKETGQSERFVTTFDVGGRRAEFDVFASSVRNPFRLPELTQFRCPTAL